MKRKRPGTEQDRRNRYQRNQRKKKAPAGPAKHAAKKLPERRAMIAAARRRIGTALPKLAKRPARWSRGLDRAANRVLERAHPVLVRSGEWSRRRAKSAAIWVGPKVRPLAARFFRAIAVGERWLRRGCTATVRGATRASAIVTPQRAIGVVIVAAGAGLVASQFLDYRGVEIGQAGYAGLPSVAQPPAVDIKTAGEAHSYLLVPLGLFAALLGLLAASRDRRRLGLTVAGLGLVAVAVILLVDLPNGLDAGAQTSRFAGATAVLEDGFYAELAAAAGLVVAGLLYYARPCRIRISSSGRAASARRRRPRRRASSQARVARSA
jgi:hypothetical protein